MEGRREEEYKEKPSQWEIFGVSGPMHLTSLDWRLPDHRRSVAASLVQGVYILERDHQLARAENKALAPIWWEFFHFRRIDVLEDPIDSSIFGAIFEYKPHTYKHFYSKPNQILAPRYVIAFRGTLIKPDTRRRDFYLDAQLPFKGLPQDHRYQKALQAVQGIIFKLGPANVWLAGHSLGAAIALQVGKDMAKRGTYIETYLFNPPFNSIPIEMISNTSLKNRIRFGKTVLTAGISLAMDRRKDSNSAPPKSDPFTMLCSWTPYLFVNPEDPISCEYIGYFQIQDRMEALGMGRIANIATRTSMMNMLLGALGREGEPPHLVPSAFLTKNMIFMEQNVSVAHGIHQWWKPHPYWQSKLYSYTGCNCK